jgi:thioredoxin reductase
MIDADVLVVGGGVAGLSAAMQVARACRPVVVVDAGEPRNRFAAHARGFAGHDGVKPGEILRRMRDELVAYESATFLQDRVTVASARDNGFDVATSSAATFRARRLVLASGVVDELPRIEGFAERWGRSAFQCPYCHGYEHRGQALGVVAAGAMGATLALLLADWGPVTLIDSPGPQRAPEERRALELRHVTCRQAAIARITGTANVELEGGETLAFGALFTVTRKRFADDLASQLGCELDAGPAGAIIRADAQRATTVRGVFACGDAARMAASLAIAVGDGATAGMAAHQSLVFSPRAP